MGDIRDELSDVEHAIETRERAKFNDEALRATWIKSGRGVWIETHRGVGGPDPQPPEGDQIGDFATEALAQRAVTAANLHDRLVAFVRFAAKCEHVEMLEEMANGLLEEIDE